MQSQKSVCVICNPFVKCPTLQSLERHVWFHHKLTPVQYNCAFHQQTFKSFYKFYEHLFSHHPEIPDEQQRFQPFYANFDPQLHTSVITYYIPN
jgi:hypothetical protein